MSTRRQQKFIDFEVQSHLVVRLCCHWLVFVLTTSVAMFFWTRLTEGPTVDWSSAWVRFTNNAIPMGLVSLSLLPPFILDAVKLSNRFTGPVFRLRTTLAKLAAGEKVQPLEFRSNDFWQTLAEDFNRVASLKSEPATTASTNGKQES